MNTFIGAFIATSIVKWINRFLSEALERRAVADKDNRQEGTLDDGDYDDDIDDDIDADDS